MGTRRIIARDMDVAMGIDVAKGNLAVTMLTADGELKQALRFKVLGTSLLALLPWDIITLRLHQVGVIIDIPGTARIM